MERTGPQEVGERLREHRKASALTQEEVAHAVGRRQATISDWESGRTVPSVEDLYRLADLFGCAVPDLLPARNSDWRGTALRGIREEIMPETFTVMADILARATVLISPRTQALPLAVGDRYWTPDDLLLAADSTRPVVDVVDLARSLGARVVATRVFDPALSGMLIELDEGPVIAVNSCHPTERQRFTVAHELGHLLLGHHGSLCHERSPKTDAEAVRSYDRTDETRANAFAAELLMPEERVRAFVARGNLAYAAASLQVSKAALTYRMMALSMVGDGDAVEVTS